MNKPISHSRQDETSDAKARWFQSLPLSDRMDLLCVFTDLVLENNPKIVDLKDAQPASGRVCVLSLEDVRLLELDREDKEL
jgi:hypothetical protein